MTPPDPFGLGPAGAPAKPASALLTGLKNIGMFFAALIATVLIASLFKSALASTGGHAAGRYYLETSTAIRAGETLSPSNTVWRAGAAKRGSDVLSSDTKGADVYWGWQALAPIRAGQAVTKSAVVDARADAATLSPPPGKVGFILAGDELTSVSQVLRPGARVDVIAVAGGGRNASAAAAVATLVQAAPVLHVRGGLKRGGRGLDASVTLAVSPEEAEDMAAWRRNGSLVLTVSGPNSADPSRLGQWRALYDDAEVNASDAAADPRPAAEHASSGAKGSVATPPPSSSVAVITPSGARQQALP